MKKNKDYNLLIIIVILLLVVLGLLFLNNSGNKNANNEPEVKLLDNYSRFFTVNSCVYKYIMFISSKNVDDLINVLDTKYIENYSVTKDNIFKYTGELNGNYSFKSKKIYYQEESKNLVKYYVYGYLIKENIDGIVDKSDYYLIVNLDLEKQVFSITPYDGEIFKEVK